jgi:hypothetical protein
MFIWTLKFTLRGVEIRLYSFFNPGARWGWAVNAAPRLLYPRAWPCTPWTEVWVGRGRGVDGYVKYRLLRVSFRCPSAWPLKIELRGCPETSLRNYHSTLRKIPKERRSHLHRVVSLKSRTVWMFLNFMRIGGHRLRRNIYLCMGCVASWWVLLSL